MSTYHFIAASEAFLTEEEPLEEVLRERLLLTEEDLTGGDKVIGAHGWRWPNRGSRRGF